MIFTSICCDNLSIDEIIERAEKGDCEAQYIVGFYYNRDSAIDSPDDEKAFYWLKLAAEQGHCEAQDFRQSILRIKAVAKDNDDAIFTKKALYKAILFASNASAGYWIVEKTPIIKEAVVWYQIAAESGTFPAQQFRWMYRTTRPQDGYAGTLNKLQHTHSDAQNNLADLVKTGKRRCSKRDTRRILVFEKRTENRHAQFQIARGIIMAGEGVTSGLYASDVLVFEGYAQGAFALTSTSVIWINTDKARR